VLTARFDPGGVLHCLPGSVDFGPVVLGTGGVTRTLTCTNDGPSRLVITGVTTGGTTPADFTPTGLTPTDCPVRTTLAPGGSCPLTVRFDPTATGQRMAVVTIFHNQQGKGAPAKVGVSGTGIARSTTLSFTPNPVTFPEQLGLTTSPARTVTVTNTGT